MAHIDTDQLRDVHALVDRLDELEPGDRVQTLEAARVVVQGALVDAVQDWVATGASWTDVGRVWGISRQAAWERFREPASR